MIRDDQVKHELENEQDQRVRNILTLGTSAQKFLTSELGKRITCIAENKVMSSLHQLATVDPADVKEIVRLQVTAELYGEFEITLFELVRQANNIIEGKELSDTFD